MTALHSPAVPAASSAIKTRLAPHAAALLPGMVAVALMLLWAVHDGGYDSDTWYWGALMLLGVVAVVVIGLGLGRLRLSRAGVVALSAFSLYVAWSYLSITWAQSPGDALQGSNRALLYLLMFGLMLSLPWTAEGALAVLVTFAVGVGLIAIVLLLRLASADNVSRLVIDGRLAAPTGYFNSTVALFMIDALVAIALASRRELPGLLRGVLIALASADLQLVLIGQSRGWLFTLPLVLIVAFAIVRDRVRVALAAVLPIVAVIVPLHRLLNVFQSDVPAALNHAASSAGRASLLLCTTMLVVGTVIAWGEKLVRPPRISPSRRRQLGAGIAVLAIAAGCAGALAATNGDPLGFVKRQWRGFSHPAVAAGGTHFSAVGSGRYDFWRVSLDAVLAHPIGGLGQDNFSDYYVTRRRTDEEPQWTHSLEMRLLAHTGFVGFGLFAAFLIAAIAAALGAVRRRSDMGRWVAGAAMLPLVVWLIHGSVDWFWEMPALSGPALGFLGVAAALGRAPARPAEARPARSRLRRGAPVLAGGLAFLIAAAVLGLPYLSVREVSNASDVSAANPSAALSDLSTAADLNPLSSEPGRLAGAIALQTGSFTVAEERFSQAISREPGGWFAWLGDGLAASALAETARAHHDFEVAESINSRQPAVRDALARVYGRHPLSAAQAFKLFVLAS